MTEKEVKPSFSLKYLVLTLLTTMIVSGIGLLISKIYESKPVKEMEVFQDSQVDIFNDDAFPKDLIEATYYLKGNPKKKIAMLFRKVVLIRNSGNEGAENVLVTAALAEKDAHLVAMPKITTEPKDIVDVVSVSRVEGGNSNRPTWNISLLNPGESVKFEYFVYSEKKLRQINLNILPRKKDWKIINHSLFDRTQKDTDRLYNFFVIASSVPMAFLLLMLVLSFPFYRYQWNKRPDYREKYGSFWAFYKRHSPWELLKSSSPD